MKSSSDLLGLALFTFVTAAILLFHTILWMIFALIPPFSLVGVLNRHFGQDGIVTDMELLTTLFITLVFSVGWGIVITKLRNHSMKFFKEQTDDFFKEINEINKILKNSKK